LPKRPTFAEFFKYIAMDILCFALVVGYVLDLFFGDPRWLPHPIVAFGHAIHFVDKKLNKKSIALASGVFVGLVLPLSVYALFFFVQYLLHEWSTVAEFVFVAVFVFFGIANSSLLREGKEVLKELNLNGLSAGRKRLSWIVGRETSALSKKQIYIAVLETVSENLSDGVIAPLFYYWVGGVPVMMAYKMINTLDSMVGYKNETYKQFGCFSAKLDDVANFLPARITALLMVLVAGSPRGTKFIVKYGRKHASPNAGFPEAAMAGILNCRFGGPNWYHGKLVEKPFIGDCDREITESDFRKAVYVNHASTFVAVAIIFALQVREGGNIAFLF